MIHGSRCISRHTLVRSTDGGQHPQPHRDWPHIRRTGQLPSDRPGLRHREHQIYLGRGSGDRCRHPAAAPWSSYRRRGNPSLTPILLAVTSTAIGVRRVVPPRGLRPLLTMCMAIVPAVRVREACHHDWLRPAPMTAGFGSAAIRVRRSAPAARAAGSTGPATCPPWPSPHGGKRNARKREQGSSAGVRRG